MLYQKQKRKRKEKEKPSYQLMLGQVLQKLKFLIKRWNVFFWIFANIFLVSDYNFDCFAHFCNNFEKISAWQFDLRFFFNTTTTTRTASKPTTTTFVSHKWKIFENQLKHTKELKIIFLLFKKRKTRIGNKNFKIIKIGHQKSFNFQLIIFFVSLLLFFGIKEFMLFSWQWEYFLSVDFVDFAGL